MPLHNYNYKLNDTMSLRDRLMMSTSLSSSELRERKTLREVMTIANPVLLGMLLIACGGGGGGSPAPKSAPEIPLELEITPTGGNPIASDDAAGLLPEKSNGVLDGAIALGTINDNKNDDGEAVYVLNDDTADIDNGDFTILNNVLSYIGYDSGYFGADGSKKSYIIDILRYDDAEHFQNRNEPNAKQPQAVTYVIRLQNNELALPSATNTGADGVGLYLSTSIDGEALNIYTRGDGTRTNPADGKDARDFDTIDLALLEEGADGSGTAIELGTLAHDDYEPDYVDDADDGAGDGDDIFVTYVYSLVAGAGTEYSNGLFDITENVLSFTGSDSGDYATSPTIDVQIAISHIVTIELADGVVTQYGADASGDATDTDTREFAFSGGAMDNPKEVRTIAAENTLNFGGIILTPVAGSEADDGFSIFIAHRAAAGGQVGVRVDGSMITVEYARGSTFAQLKSAFDSAVALGSGHALERMFNITTDSTYKSADNLIGDGTLSNIDKALRDFLGGDSSTKASVTLGDATIEASAVGGAYNRIINFDGRYDSTRSANYMDVTVGTLNSTFSIVVTYGLGATLEQLMTELGTLWTADTTPMLGTIAFYLSQPPSDGFTANTLLADIFGTYDGIITAGNVVRAHRTIDVAEGDIYLVDADAGSGKIIKFAAVEDLRVYEDSFVIVTDADGDGIGEVSAVAKTSLPDIDYYVLGEVEVVPVTGAQARLTKTALVGSDTGSVTFTADEGGTEGNDLSVTFIFSGVSAGNAADVSFAYASNNLTITYDFGATLTKIKTEFDAVTDADITSRFDLVINSGGNITATNVLGSQTTGTAEALTGGTGGTTMGGTPDPNDSGTQQTGSLQWIGDEIEDYTINLRPSAEESVPNAKDSASKTLEDILKEMEAEHQSAPPQENQPQWQPESYNGDSDLIDLPDTGPDIL